MKKLNKFAMCALILPVGAFAAAGAPTADNPQHETGSGQSHAGQHESQHGASSPGVSKSDQDRKSPESRTAADMRKAMSGTDKKAEFMTTTPNDAVRIDNVIGSNLYARHNEASASRAGDDLANRSKDEKLGTIDDLIIDESGQIVAVVMSIGGMLGMGENSVAVSWDAIQRTLNEDRDGYRFSINATAEELENAPSYDKKSDGIRLSSATPN